jgi:ketosteroid isomerase-like protein
MLEQDMSRPSLRRPFLNPSCTFVSFVVVAVLLLGCAGPPKKATWKNATGAGEYERLMWKAIQKGDWKVIEFHLASEFVGVNASGRTLDRYAWLEYWKQAQPQETLVSEVRTRPEGVDTVVTLVLHLSGPSSTSAPEKHAYRVLSVWQQVKGGWSLTATSITPLAAE